MSQTSKILVEAVFQDPNQLRILVEVDTLEEAKTEVAIITNQYAALKVVWIYEKEAAHIFDRHGDYLFTAQGMSGPEEG